MATRKKKATKKAAGKKKRTKKQAAPPFKTSRSPKDLAFPYKLQGNVITVLKSDLVELGITVERAGEAIVLRCGEAWKENETATTYSWRIG